MATEQQTIEFKTLLKNEGKLTGFFRSYISLWSDKLYTNGLISQEVFETETDNIADPTKAKNMTLCVLDCVSKDPGKYSVFMSTLKALGEQYGAAIVYEDLTKDYEDILAGKVEEAANSDSELLYAGDLLGSTSNAPLATTLPSAQDEQTVVTTQGGSQGDDRPSENRSSEEKSSSVIAEQPRFNNDDKRKMQEKSNGIRVESEAPESFMSEVVVLIQTVKQEEQLAVYEHMKPPTAEMKAPITWICEHPKIALTLGMFGDHKTAVIRTKKGGNCQSEIVYALNKLPNVKLIIAVGFAYGRRKKCSLGDVIVSTTVDGVTELRCENDKTNLGEGTVRYTEMKLSAQTAFAKQEWMDFNCIKTGNRNSVVHAGVILSSPVLLNDRKVLQDFLKNNSRFIGGEMEGQQLALCTHQFLEDNKREVDFIVIKGVADFGDGTKEGNWQLTASLAAAKYAEESLSKTNGQVYKLQGWQNSSNWILAILAAVVLCVSVIVVRGSSNGKVTFNGDSSTLMEGRPNNIVSLRNFPHMHERPSMIQLSMLERGAGGGKPVRIIKKIGSKNAELGHFLLNDEDGSIMETIVDNTRGNNEAVNREMFRRWLAGSGVQPVTWKKLVEALERFKLKELANDIVDALHT